MRFHAKPLARFAGRWYRFQSPLTAVELLASGTINILGGVVRSIHQVALAPDAQVHAQATSLDGRKRQAHAQPAL